MKTSAILKGVYTIIVVVVVAALGASFTHMKDWTLHVLPDDTPDAFGWVNAIISELTPLAGSLYLMHVHKHGGPKWPAWVMLIYGFSASAIGQVHAAGDNPTLWALIAALLPVTAAFVLIKVLFILLESAEAAPSDQGPPAPVNAHLNPSAPAQVTVHHPAPGAFTPPVVNAPEPVMNTPAVHTVEVVHDSDVHAGQDPCTPAVNNEPEAVHGELEQRVHDRPVHSPKKTVNKAKKPAVNKPVNKPVNADREQLRRDVHELRRTMTVRAVADQLGISTGLVNKLSKEPLDPVADAEVRLSDEQFDAELAKLLSGETKKNDDET